MHFQLFLLTFPALFIVCIDAKGRRGDLDVQYRADQYFSAGNRAGNSEEDEDDLDKAAELVDNEIGDSQASARRRNNNDQELYAYMGQTCGASTGSSSEVQKMAIKKDVWEHAGCLGCTTEQLDERYGTTRRRSGGGGGGRRAAFLSTSGSFTLSSGGGGGNRRAEFLLGSAEGEDANAGCCDHMLLQLKSNDELWFGIQNAPADQAVLTNPTKSVKIGKKGECVGKCQKIVPALQSWFPSFTKSVIEKCVACSRAVAGATRL